MIHVRKLKSLGASVSHVDGKLKISGLDRLDRDTAVRLLTLAHNYKNEILAELRGQIGKAPPNVPNRNKAVRHKTSARASGLECIKKA